MTEDGEMEGIRAEVERLRADLRPPQCDHVWVRTAMREPGGVCESVGCGGTVVILCSKCGETQ